MSPVITLTTDYGDDSPYAAILKGVILTINPLARLIDLCHQIPAQDLRHADYFVNTALPYFPTGTIHVVVVDPGVGSNRAGLYVDVGGQRLIGPDNGTFTGIIRHHTHQVCIRQLTNPRYWNTHVSDTFHGRDIFAPVAAYLSLGLDPAELGPIVEHHVALPAHSAVTFGNRWQGEVQFIDHFGNIITNIPSGGIKSLPVTITIGGINSHPIRWVRTYSDAAPGELVSLFSSDGYFEIAVVNGHAARRVDARIGTEVTIQTE